MLEWWAYKHINGSIHIKRYLGDPLDLQEAGESPFVYIYTDVFTAINADEALKLANELL